MLEARNKENFLDLVGPTKMDALEAASVPGFALHAPASSPRPNQQRI